MIRRRLARRSTHTPAGIDSSREGISGAAVSHAIAVAPASNSSTAASGIAMRWISSPTRDTLWPTQ